MRWCFLKEANTKFDMLDHQDVEVVSSQFYVNGRKVDYLAHIGSHPTGESMVG